MPRRAWLEALCVPRIRAASWANKPMQACLMVEEGASVPLQIEPEKIPTFAFPEAAARALGKVVVIGCWRATAGMPQPM